MADKYAHKRTIAKRPKGTWKRWKMCLSKKSYPSKEEAIRHMYGNVIRAYLCDLCRQWHLTKQEKK